MASTYKRVENSRGVTWSTVADIGIDPATGRRRQKRISGKTRKDAERKAAEAIHRADNGFVDPKNATVNDLFAAWLDATSPTLRPATLRRYQDVHRLYIGGNIGGVKLAKLTAGDVQRLYADLRERLTPTSIRHLHSILHHALDDAMKWGWLTRNVTDAVEPPKRNSAEMTVWSTAEVRQFLTAAIGDDLESLYRLALTTGMRRGELLGLKWSDIDMDSGAIAVRRTLSRGESSRLIEGEPKTQAGRRRITLPAATIESLRRHRTAQLEYRLRVGPVYTDHGYVFTNEAGGYLHPNALRRQFLKMTGKAGVPAIRFHDLRHTSATMLLAEGVHPKIVQERLGHSDIAMTLNLYSHVTPDMQQAAADAIETALSRVS
ncbi:site-specific integrase [soil metagenome]